MTMRTEPAYSRYETLLKRLHDLNGEGKLDSPEADSVREDMDEPWSRLSKSEKELLSGLSSDLYSFCDKEVIRISDLDKTALVGKMRTTYESGDWVGLLEALRLGHQYLRPEMVAYMRGRCWQQLGRPQPAIWFLDRAHQLDPTDGGYAYLKLDALLRGGRRAQALEEAKQLLSKQETPLPSLFAAARVFLDSAADLPPEDARQLYDSIVTSVSSALRSLAESGSNQSTIPQSVILAGRLHLALAYEKLGKLDEARQTYIDAIAYHPNSDELLMARALFLMKTDPQAAQRDLEALIDRGTSLAQAHLFRAHHFLLQKDYRRCLELADRGLRLANRTDTRVAFLEWIAISLYELGAPLGDVRSTLEEALALDPFNEDVRGHLSILKQTTSASHPALSSRAVPDPFVALQDLRSQLQPALGTTAPSTKHLGPGSTHDRERRVSHGGAAETGRSLRLLVGWAHPRRANPPGAALPAQRL